MAAGVKTLIRLRVVPNARRTEVAGEYGDAIKIKVQALALEGKANEALRDFLAERLRVAVGSIDLAAGEKSRDKTVAIMGLSTEEIRSRLLAT